MTLVSFVVKRSAHKVATVESVIILFLTSIYAYLRFYSYAGGMMSVASFPIDTSIGISFLVGVTPVLSAEQCNQKENRNDDCFPENVEKQEIS